MRSRAWIWLFHGWRARADRRRGRPHRAVCRQASDRREFELVNPMWLEPMWAPNALHRTDMTLKPIASAIIAPVQCVASTGGSSALRRPPVPIHLPGAARCARDPSCRLEDHFATSCPLFSTTKCPKMAMPRNRRTSLALIRMLRLNDVMFAK